MSSLKEQREQLLQKKMKEMADIGVKKRTAENTPDFDEPIDLDEEIISEAPVSGGVEKEEKTNEVSTELIALSPKRKKAGKDNYSFHANGLCRIRAAFSHKCAQRAQQVRF